MDLPAQQRWSVCVETILTTYGWENSFGPVFEAWNEYNFIRMVHANPEMPSIMWNAIQKYWPEQAGEIEGIAATFVAHNHSITPEYLSQWVYAHEIVHANYSCVNCKAATPEWLHVGECTGVLVQDAGGHVLHGRNLDNGPQNLRNITLQISFVQNGSLVYVAVDWWWFTSGVETLMKPGVASISENMRDGTISTEELLTGVTSGLLPQTFWLRTILDTAENFSAVTKWLIEQPAIAPQYLIVAGTAANEGCVIARAADDATNPRPVFSLNQTTWFLVETNSDLWEEDVLWDPRHQVAVALLSQYSQAQGASLLPVWSVINTWPVRNNNTIYSVVMQPSTGLITGVAQNGMAVPCSGPLTRPPEPSSSSSSDRR